MALKYRHYILKRKIEDVLMYPLILLGRFIAIFKPISRQYETFFFFPFYHTGGAEKVHSLVAQATANGNCIIFFTRKSHDKNFLNDFIKSGAVIRDISTYTDNKLLYPFNIIYRGIISAYINHQNTPVRVFNGQCNFAYKLSPWLKPTIPQVELIHSFNTFSLIRLPFLLFIDKTVMISHERIKDHLAQYEKLGVPNHFRDKIMYITNGIPLPKINRQKDYTQTVNVLYVGRGTEEKRVHIIAKIAEQAHKKNLPVQCMFMGEVREAIPATLLPYCTLLGHKNNPTEIDDVYWKAHVIIITSSTEGFPMVIEEGMARGCAVIATPVGDIPYHIKPPVNGFLFSTAINEEIIIKEGVDYLTALSTNRQLLGEMAEANMRYARENFSIETFNESYRDLFNQLRNHND